MDQEKVAEEGCGSDVAVVARAAELEQLSLWARLTQVRINPANNKCTTLPILKLNNPYSINFHLCVSLGSSVEIDHRTRIDPG